MTEQELTASAEQCRRCMRIHYGPHACARGWAGPAITAAIRSADEEAVRGLGVALASAHVAPAAEMDIFELASELRAKYPGAETEADVARALAEFSRALNMGGWLSGSCGVVTDTIACPYGCGEAFLLYDDGRDPLKRHVEHCPKRDDDDGDYE